MVKKKSYYKPKVRTYYETAEEIISTYEKFVDLIKVADYVTYSSFGQLRARMTKTYTRNDKDQFWFGNSKKRAVSLLQRAFLENPLPSNVDARGMVIRGGEYDDVEDCNRVLPMVWMRESTDQTMLCINNFVFWQKERIPNDRG